MLFLLPVSVKILKPSVRFPCVIRHGLKVVLSSPLSYSLLVISSCTAGSSLAGDLGSHFLGSLFRSLTAADLQLCGLVHPAMRSSLQVSQLHFIEGLWVSGCTLAVKAERSPTVVIS